MTKYECTNRLCEWYDSTNYCCKIGHDTSNCKLVKEEKTNQEFNIEKHLKEWKENLTDDFKQILTENAIKHQIEMR